MMVESFPCGAVVFEKLVKQFHKRNFRLGRKLGITDAMDLRESSENIAL